MALLKYKFFVYSDSMDYVENILSLISPDEILNLPWQIKGPTLAIIAFLLFRSFFSILKFRPIKALSSLVYAVLIAIIISSTGHLLVAFIPETGKTTTEQVK